MNDHVEGNVVVAGDKVYAGIDEDDRCEVCHAVVIEFKDEADFRKAITTGKANFTLFEGK